MEETWRCFAAVGSGRNGERIIESKVTASFVIPLLELSAQQFTFTYQYEAGVPLRPQTQTLTMKNTTALPLVFSMHW